MRFSNTLNYMISTGQGYRNNSISSGVKSLSDIITYETCELYNEDIFDFMKKYYDDYNVDNLTTADSVDYTLQYLSTLLNTTVDNLKGVWLTTHQDVLDVYCPDGCDVDIETVYIHEHKMIPISDLGRDGTLFVYIEDETKNNFDTLIKDLKDIVENSEVTV